MPITSPETPIIDMSNSYFRFKKFRIDQDRCAMKVSTDAMVLGALADHSDPKSVLDIGTGTGILALMIAQRFPLSKITAVELDEAAFSQATENCHNSPWPQRINIQHRSFQQFSASSFQTFDLIVSNPPYFPYHIQSRNAQRNLALHNDALPFGDLVEGVTKLLDQKGQFWLVLPERQMEDMVGLCLSHGLFPVQKVVLKDRSNTGILRVFQSFAFEKRVESKMLEIIMKKEDLTYTEQYHLLLRDFMLHF